MARRCFYSFHYDGDNWRASTVRNIGAIEGSQTVSDNDWETITKGGDRAIESWIAGQMNGKSCTILLIGAATAGRKWIEYEITKTWNDGKGIFGIYVHNLLDRYQRKSAEGNNPFVGFTLKSSGAALSSIVNVYDPPYTQSKDVYNHIAGNIEDWVDAAIKIRAEY